MVIRTGEPRKPPSGLLVRQVDHWAVRWRRTWRGSVFTNFLLPVLYLLAMGVGLGGYVDDGGAARSLGGVDYLDFLAPGLLATTVFQNAVGASTWPVLGAIKWDKTYHAMLATPLRVRDVLLGTLAFIGARLALTATVFLLVLVAFGVASSPSAVLALPAAVLVGMAHATPIIAFTSCLERPSGFVLLFRLGVVPMFLFSGAFFPVSQLPALLQGLARVMPLYHGVELVRALVLGTYGAGDLLHVVYLVGWLLVGFWLADRLLARRLGGG